MGYLSLGGPYNRFGLGIAYAGAGKTTTVIDMVFRYLQNIQGDSKVLYLVFNTFMKNEIASKLGKEGSWFEDFPVERFEVFNLHGFIRSKLEERYGDHIGFYYKNGHIDYTVFKMILERLWGTQNFDGYFMKLVVDKLDEFALVPAKTSEFDFSLNLNDYAYERFVKGSKGESAPSLLRDIGAEEGFSIEGMSYSHFESAMADIVKRIASAVYDAGLIRDAMPHSVYYKYALLNLDIERMDIFEGYDNVVIDEAQDLDRIIMAMVEASKKPVFLLGDIWQNIYRFRGAFNALTYIQEKYDVEPFKLTKSYRLSPENAFVATAFLNSYATELGLMEGKEPIQIYGNSKQVSRRLFHTAQADEFANEIVTRFINLDLSEHPLYQKESQREVFKKKWGDFIPNGKKMLAKKMVKDAAAKITTRAKTAPEDAKSFANTFMQAVQGMENVKMLHDLFPDLEIINEETGEIDAYNLKRMLFGRKRTGLVREIINDAGQYAFISRNNDKALEMLYKVVSAVPEEKVRDVPTLYIRYENSIDDKMKAIDSMNLKFIPGRDRKIDFIEVVKNLLAQRYGGGALTRLIKNRISAASIFDAIKARMNGIVRPPIFQASRFIFNPTQEDADFEHFASKIASLLDTEAVERVLDEQEYQKFAKLLRSRDRSAPLFYLVERGMLPLRGSEFTPYQIMGIGQMIAGIDSKVVADCENSDLRLFYYYTKFTEARRKNPNVQTTTKNDFNIYVSTAHKTKGLEFQNVMLANDLSVTTGEMDDDQRRDEFNLAYTAMTRAKQDIIYEAMPDGKPSPFQEMVQNAVKDFERVYYSNRVKVIEQAHGNCMTFDIETANDTMRESFLASASPVYADIAVDVDPQTQKINRVYFRQSGDSIPSQRDNPNIEYVRAVTEEEARAFETMRRAFIEQQGAQRHPPADSMRTGVAHEQSREQSREIDSPSYYNDVEPEMFSSDEEYERYIRDCGDDPGF